MADKYRCCEERKISVARNGIRYFIALTLFLRHCIYALEKGYPELFCFSNNRMVQLYHEKNATCYNVQTRDYADKKKQLIKLLFLRIDSLLVLLYHSLLERIAPFFLPARMEPNKRRSIKKRSCMNFLKPTCISIRWQFTQKQDERYKNSK